MLVKRNDLFEKGYYNTGEAGFIEMYDFSEGNKTLENRVKVVSQIASVCYGNNGLKPNFKLYDKLARESIGLPSSSFEFVPVLINVDKFTKLQDYFMQAIACIDKKQECFCDFGKRDFVLNSVRYGYSFTDEKGNGFVLTNLRALMYDLELIKNITHKEDEFLNIESKFWLNKTKKEVELIKSKFKVFRIKATIRDFRQFLRHRRSSVQELSRRFTTGNKVPFEFRYSLNLMNNYPELIDEDEKRVEKYFELLEKGVKAEDARDILPVSLYSILWCGFYPDGLENMLNLRTKSSAQKGIREIAENMQKMVLST
jgi:thymidylate synthase (FAD)